jgi:hypothetical protein
MPVEIVTSQESPKEGALKTWTPLLGMEFNRFIETLPTDQADRLNLEAPRILSACVEPYKSGIENRSNAGLVIGYVQSGKTSSFTAVTALAKDNKYNCIIIIGGTGMILLDQTVKRLRKDLGLEKIDAVNRWLFSKNPKLLANRPDVNQLQNLLSTQSQQVLSGIPQIGATPLIAVMKESSHLKNLNEILTNLAGPDKKGLSGITALIIDDECHMSSPDIGKKDQQSKIYSLMRELRSYVPNHTLLQYTATPQANLLCTLNDEFRPEFVRLLGTGRDYTGGKRFFVDQPKGQNIRKIPIEEQQTALAARQEDSPPDTLLKAFATYLLIAADDFYINQIKNENNFQQFSMLVHSNSSLSTHKIFNDWLSSLKTTWLGVLNRPKEDVDRVDLVKDVFLPAFNDIQLTAEPKLNQLDLLLDLPINNVLSSLIIWLVNGNKKGGGVRDPEFNISNYNIINGGDMLGVGFTIPKLVVTHMLRGGGQNQLDTVQQRGRFFGYCADWFDKIRVWIGDEVQHLFTAYVDHEERLRATLIGYDQNNLNLKTWKVKLRLDRSANACRRGAIKLEMKQFKTNDGWVDQDYWSDNTENKKFNLDRVTDFLNSQNQFAGINPKPIFKPSQSMFTGGTPDTSHHSAEYRLKDVIQLFSDYKLESRNSDEFDVLYETLLEFEDKAAYEFVDVFHIAQGKSPGLRRRKIGAGGHVDLHQGDNLPHYVGDRKVRTDRITLQVRFLNHGDSDANITEQNVVYLSVWLPDETKVWAEGWILQNE